MFGMASYGASPKVSFADMVSMGFKLILKNHFRHQYTRFERFIDTRNIRAIRIRWDVSCLVGSVLRAKALPNFSYRAIPVD